MADRPFPARLVKPSVIPGFGVALGFTLTYLSLIVLIPLAGLVFKTGRADLPGNAAEPVPLEVLRRQDPDNTGGRQRALKPDAANVSRCDRRAQDRRMQTRRLMMIGYEAPCPADEPLVFRPKHPAADMGRLPLRRLRVVACARHHRLNSHDCLR